MPRVKKSLQLVTEDYTLSGEICKAATDTEQRIVFGWAYVCKDEDGQQVIDKSGERITDPAELEIASYAFMLNSRVGKDWHDLMKAEGYQPGMPAASVVESMFFSVEKMEAMGIPVGTLPVGWWIGMKVHDDDLWDEYEAGNRQMFSVHGAGLARAA